MQKVDLPTICLWILKVWDKLPAEIIRRAFLKWSNSLDGTEDDVLWEGDLGSTSETDDSNADLLYADSDEELHTVFDETDNEEFLGFSFTALPTQQPFSRIPNNKKECVLK